MSKKQNVIVFGAGKAGVSALNNLRTTYNILALSDNDHDKHGQYVDGILIISPQQITDYVFDKILVASEYYEQIVSQLVSLYSINADVIQTLPATAIKGLHFEDSASVKNTAEKILLCICKILSKLDIKYHIDAGTLLGLYRDGELIPWDDDLDIAIPVSEVARIKQGKLQILNALKQITNVEWSIDEHTSTMAFGLVPKGAVRSFKLSPVDSNAALPMVDFFIKYSDHTVMDYVIASRGFRMPSLHIKQLETINFKGHELNTPFDTEGYLTKHYGDWKTPKKNWSLQDIKSATVF